MAKAKLIPAAEAAREAALSREAMVRKIQTQEIQGAVVKGRWFVDSASLSRFMSRQGEMVPAR